MKITQEILDNGKWLSEDIFKFKGRKYIKAICTYCGEDCFSDIGKPNRKEIFCSLECGRGSRRGKKDTDESRKKKSESNIGKHSQPKSPEHCKKISESKKGQEPWNKGKTGVLSPESIAKMIKAKIGCVPWNLSHYASKNIPKYDLYVGRLEPYEECKRSKRDPNVLRVKCVYCGIWFVPTLTQVMNRLDGINGNDINRFYCSKGCKRECPSYKRVKYYKGQKGFNSREVQPELRKLVFARDGYECQKCGSSKSLHCHHITGVELNPIESADVDNCITFCKTCHKEAHTDRGCRYIDLRRCPEENQTMVVNT